MTREERDAENFNNLKACLKFIKNNGTVYPRLEHYAKHFNISIGYINKAYRQKYVIKTKQGYKVKATISDNEIKDLILETKEYFRISKQKSRNKLSQQIIKKPNFIKRLLLKIYAIFKNKK